LCDLNTRFWEIRRIEEMKWYTVLLLVALAIASTSAQALTPGNSYYVSWTGGFDLEGITINGGGFLCGAINVNVTDLNPDAYGVTENLNTLCATPTVDFQNGVSAYEDITVSNQTAYLLKNFTLANDAASYKNVVINSVTTPISAGDWNAGYQMAVWELEDPSIALSGYSLGAGETASYLYGAAVTNASTGQTRILGFNGLDGQPMSQNLVTPVPEPGMLMAAFSILAPAGFLFRRKMA